MKSPDRGWSNPVIALAVVVQDSLDARRCDDSSAAHLVAPPRIVDVDVGDLVIGDRERRARARVEHLESQLLAARQSFPRCRSTRLMWTGVET